jgi:hypothetical protein
MDMKTSAAMACTVGVGLMWSVLAGAAAVGQPASGGAPDKKDAPKPAPWNTGFAVVEVFTSEGCSSCPPADALAATLAREAKEQGKSVFVVAMHVDYWNYLGWKDPFAQSVFTRRQRAYAAAIGKTGGNSGVFTPEMVVNGSVGFTGSDAAMARREIDKALASGGRLKIEASVLPRKAGEPVKVHANVKGDTRWTTLSVAVVEDGLRVDVKSGENAGKTLTHDRVTRVFGQAKVTDDQADVELKLPAGVHEEKCHVVVFAQDDKTMRVLAGTEIGLEPAGKSTPDKAAADATPKEPAPAK